MLRPRQQIRPHTRRQRDIPRAERIGVQQGGSFLPILGRGVGLDEQRIGRVPAHQRSAAAGDRIVHRGGGMREFHFGKVMIFMPCPGTEWLAERSIEENPADAGHMGEHAVKHPPSIFITIEALRDVIPQVTTGLGNPEGQRVLDRPPEQVRAMMPKVTDHISRCRVADTQHPRLRCLIAHLVNRPGLDRCQRPHRPVIHHLGRQRNSRCHLCAPYRHAGSPHCLVGQLERRVHAEPRPRNEFLADWLGEALDNRYIQRQAGRFRRRWIPSGPEQRKS